MANDRKVISLVPGKPDTLSSAIAEMRDRMPGVIEYNRIIARVQRQAYLAYIEEGFTPKQALELCKGAKL